MSSCSLIVLTPGAGGQPDTAAWKLTRIEGWKQLIRSVGELLAITARSA